MNKRIILVWIPLIIMAVIFIPMLTISGISIELKLTSSINYELFYIIGFYGVISIFFPFIIIFLYSISHPKFEDKINVWFEGGES